ncbi:MAG: nucleoside-diphosphate-sugar epimerase [Nitrospinales bacterium]|jgi:nucleoside-diphosphate-sugar epimerase
MSENPIKNSLFCFGLGFTAQALAKRMRAQEWTVSGSCREIDNKDSLKELSVFPFDGTHATEEIRNALSKATHLLVSIPPQLSGDVVLQKFSSQIAECKNLKWIGYISSTGVYGDTQGEWVDESSPLKPETELNIRRVEAENGWLSLAKESGCPVMIFRCAAIYGPGRNLLVSVKQGRARRIEKRGLVFSRTHVEDLAQVLEASIKKPRLREIYNVSDDEPSPPSEAVEYACKLLNIAPPPLIPFESAELSEIARGFYQTCKRVDNKKIKEELGVKLQYPDYRSGLDAIFKTM